MTVIYYEDDADPTRLRGKTVGVIGYGTQGRSIALNLRDSGIHVIASGNLDEQQLANEDQIPFNTMQEVTTQSSIIMLLLPDELIPQIYMTYISPNLRRGDTLILCSGYNITFGFIEPPPFVDVGLISPRDMSSALRQNYLNGQGYLSFVSVSQDASGEIWGIILAVAHAIGALKAGAIELRVEQEAELNLFVHQAILPALKHIVTTAANLLIQQGYPPEGVITDLYLSGKLSGFMKQASQTGLLHAIQSTDLTSQYGTISRLERFNELKLERLMEVTLTEIRSGKFAQEWAQEFLDGHPRLNKLLHKQEQQELWELEQQTIEFLEFDDL